MKTVSIKIENDFSSSKKAIFIKPIEETFEGETLKRAIGVVLHFAFGVMNSQYDAPKVTIGDFELPTALAKKLCSQDFLNFRLDFGIIRETIMSNFAMSDKDAALEFMKSTDKNGVFKDQTAFTTEQIAAQAKAQLRNVRYASRFVREDAKSSVFNEQLEARIALNAEAAKVRRIEQKKAKALLNN
jgi:hypothetical protein